MPPVDIAELERLARAATPGPWWHGKYYDRVTRTADGDGSDSIAHVYGGRGQNDNAAYIAAASPATILALVEEVREMREALVALRNMTTDPRRVAIIEGALRRAPE